MTDLSAREPGRSQGPDLTSHDDLLELEPWDQPRGPGGVPTWMGELLNFCSRCGAELRFGPIDGDHRDRLSCPACGFVAYVNPRLVVTTLPITPDGEVVLLRRGIEPGLGRGPSRAASWRSTKPCVKVPSARPWKRPA